MIVLAGAPPVPAQPMSPAATATTTARDAARLLSQWTIPQKSPFAESALSVFQSDCAKRHALPAYRSFGSSPSRRSRRHRAWAQTPAGPKRLPRTGGSDRRLCRELFGSQGAAGSHSSPCHGQQALGAGRAWSAERTPVSQAAPLQPRGRISSSSSCCSPAIGCVGASDPIIQEPTAIAFDGTATFVVEDRSYDGRT